MNARFYMLRGSGNPVVQVLSLLALAVIGIGAVVLGAVILSLLLALAFVAGAVLFVRRWWLLRKSGRQAQARQSVRTGSGAVIETTYTVVDRPNDERRRRRRN